MNAKKDNPHAGHRNRVVERFLKAGNLDDFEPHVALELLLFLSIPRIDTNALAHRLIDTFGSLSGVFDASYDELLKVQGVGPATALHLKLIPSFANAYMTDKTAATKLIHSSEEAGEYLLPRFVGKPHEELWVLCLDGKGKIISCDCVMVGSVNATQVSVRQTVAHALKKEAVSVVIAHNHPDGLALPSEDDIVATSMLGGALKTVGIRMIDHIIVAGDDFVSLAKTARFTQLFE